METTTETKNPIESNKPNNISDYDACTIIEGFDGEEHTEDEVLAAFAQLIKSGAAWSLQGSYGRQAKHLITNGYISETGEVLV
jgi:hypothetical protein